METQGVAARFKVLPLGAVKPKGWILEQFNRDLQHGFASRLDELTRHAENDLFADRIETSTELRAWWDSETRGNWLWGYTMMAYLADNPEFIAKVDDLVARLRGTQDEDGYIGIYAKEWRYNHAPGENGELWAQSRALLTLLSYYELTSDESFLNVVEEAARLTMARYGPDNSYFRTSERDEFVDIDIMGLTHGLNYVDVMEWLYNITGKTAYRDFGVWLYRDFNKLEGRFPNDDMKLKNLLKDDLPFVGHAAHTAEHLRVLLWAYFMTGSPEMERAVKNAAAKVGHYTVPSGALIGDESIHGLPLPDVGYEYCTMTDLLVSLASAQQKFGDSAYGDWIENLAFNAAQGARFADGTGVCYLSLENRFAAPASRPDSYIRFFPTGGRFKFSPTHEDIAVCCNPNAVRLMPHYVSRMWGRLPDEDGVAALTYGPSSLTTEIGGVRVVIEQETHYPFSDEVTFEVYPEKDLRFALWLRNPGWSTDTQVSAEGAEISEQAGYIVLRKTWTPGESITLSFTAMVEPILNPNGEFSVKRGPLQYVAPIPEEMYPTKSYPIHGFHDYEVTPKDPMQAYQVLLLDASQRNLGLEFDGNQDADVRRPWDEPPVKLTKDALALVPIGCTVLRRATFPLTGSSGP